MNKHFKELEAQVQKGKDVFIAHNATVIGDVQLGDQSSVWYQAVIRGDTDKIIIGERTNIQDGSIIHCDQNAPATIGSDVVVGHGAVIHGCSIGDCCLIGIRSTILNGAKIGKGCIIGANALVTENKVIPDFSMVLGVPGEVVKTLPEQVIEKIKQGADHYVQEAAKYLSSDEV